MILERSNSSDGSVLILEDFEPAAIIAMLLPISVTTLRTAAFLEVGDLMWQALMAACVLQIHTCIELFAAYLNDEAHQKRQDLGVIERSLTVTLLTRFTSLDGVSDLMRKLDEGGRWS
jgi:hypothetical protein